MSTPSYKDLRHLTDDKIIELHDQSAIHTNSASVMYCLDELHRREQERYSKIILGYTKKINLLTVLMTISAIVSAICTLILLLK